MICPHCQKEFNAGKLMGAAKTPAKKAAAKKRGEWMKKAFANQKKMEGGTPANRGTVAFEGNAVINTMTGERREYPEIPVTFDIPPKPTSLADKKAAALAALAGAARTKTVGISELIGGRDLHEAPHAPFDVNLHGEPHRVTQIGKRLGLFYLGGGEPTFTRYLEPGELEKFWEQRIK